MKKIVAAILLLVTFVNLNAQSVPTTPQIKGDMPQISPPSPTVAALMKFEEIPVSNYTGVPDISIPLFSTSTRSEDVGVNIALKYHPSEIQVDNIASWTGVGWSLDAGGVISRTVKGSPDEYIVNGRGMYSTDNHYETIFYDANGNFIDHNPAMESYEYTWNAYEKNFYDTEYDLYQFSFMGNSGRFYIKNDGTIVKLFNDVAMQINYDNTNKIFTLYDDKGFKYVFNILETSDENRLITQPNGSPITPQIGPYISAFHLSKVYDRNNQVLVEYKYAAVTEITDHTVTTYNYPLDPTIGTTVCYQCGHEADCAGNLQNLLPATSITITTNTIDTRKLSLIDIKGKGTVEFITESGRQDMNSTAVRLKGLRVKDSIGTIIKEYELIHSYLGAGKRLVLQNVTQKDTQSATVLNYTLNYNNIEGLPIRTSKDRDWWGYFNNSSNLPSGLNSENNPTYCKTGILQSMTLPTGGSTVFAFESNQYSYEGATSLTQFDNPQNWQPQTIIKNYSGYASTIEQSYMYFNLPADQTVKLVLETSGFSPVDSKNYWLFQIIPVQTIPPGNGPGGPIELNFQPSYTVDTSRLQFNIYTTDLDATLASNYYLYNKYLKAGAYVIRFLANPNGPPAPTTGGTYTLTLNYNKLTNTYRYVNGGGLRVAYIGYFKGDVDPNYYSLIINNPTIPMPVPDKEKKYNYNNFDDPLRSSGSLCYAKPVYSYKITHSHLIRCSGSQSDTQLSVDYQVVNDFNSLNPLKTQGSDVGYKYVTVTDNRRSFATQQGDINNYYIPSDNADLGRTEYTYTSPIDYPAVNYSIVYPFQDLNVDYDYKRGLLLKQKQYDKANRSLTEANLTYDTTDEGSSISGIRMFSLINCGYSEFWNTFQGYYLAATDPACNQVTTPSCGYQCGYPPTYLGYYPVYQKYGWPKLTGKNTKEYFYNSDNTAQGTKETQQSLTYNTVNKRLASETTTNSLGETELSNYYYTNYTATNRIADIDHIESRKNGNLISSSKISYSNTFAGNTSYLPAYIQSAKGTQTLENRLQFVRYDSYSNVLEAKQVNGTSVTYIWGYNKTVPIAKIENLAFSSIAAATITDLQNKSNQDNDHCNTASCKEEILRTALNGLRTTYPDALITTYTYDPLVGVTSITDPKGYRITYSYDGFGRLLNVKDQRGNLLSENEYHYKP